MTKIRVTQVRSAITQPEPQRLTLLGLGLKRRGQTVELKDTPAIRGMIRKIHHLLDVTVLEGEATLSGARHRPNRRKHIKAERS